MKRLTSIPTVYWNEGPRPFSGQHLSYYDQTILEPLTFIQQLQARTLLEDPHAFWGYELVQPVPDKWKLEKKDISLGIGGDLVWSGLLIYGVNDLYYTDPPDNTEEKDHQHGQEPGSVLEDWGTKRFLEGDLAGKGKTLAGNLIEQMRVTLLRLLPYLGYSSTNWELDFKEMVNWTTWADVHPVSIAAPYWHELGDHIFNLYTDHVETLRVSARTILNVVGQDGNHYQMDARAEDKLADQPIGLSDKLILRAKDLDSSSGHLPPTTGVVSVMQGPQANYYMTDFTLHEFRGGVFRDYAFPGLSAPATDACYFGEAITGLNPGWDCILLYLENGLIAVLEGHPLSQLWELIGEIQPIQPASQLQHPGGNIYAYERAPASDLLLQGNGIDGVTLEDPALVAVGSSSYLNLLRWGGDPQAPGPGLGVMELESSTDLGQSIQAVSCERAGGKSPEASWMTWRFLAGSGSSVRAYDFFPSELAEANLLVFSDHLLVTPDSVFLHPLTGPARTTSQVNPGFHYWLDLPVSVQDWTLVRTAIWSDPLTKVTQFHALYCVEWYYRQTPDFIHLTWELPTYDQWVGQPCEALGLGDDHYLTIQSASEEAFSLPLTRTDSYDPRSPSERPGDPEPQDISHHLAFMAVEDVVEVAGPDLAFTIQAIYFFDPDGPPGRDLVWLYQDGQDIDEPFPHDLAADTFVNVSGGWATRSYTAGENKVFITQTGLQERLDAYAENEMIPFIVSGSMEGLHSVDGLLSFYGADALGPFFVSQCPVALTVNGDYALDLVSSVTPCKARVNNDWLFNYWAAARGDSS